MLAARRPMRRPAYGCMAASGCGRHALIVHVCDMLIFNGLSLNGRRSREPLRCGCSLVNCVRQREYPVNSARSLLILSAPSLLLECCLGLDPIADVRLIPRPRPRGPAPHRGAQRLPRWTLRS